MSDRDFPKTRWELAGADASEMRYAERFGAMIERGEDIHGEARLADVLAPRAARILDAGSGIGRVGAALDARGHQVTGVEKDIDLVAESRRRYPDLPVIESDILGISPALMREHGAPEQFDLVVVVGNVMVLLADDTQVDALRAMASVLAPEGRLLTGFSLVSDHGNSRDYPFDEFTADAARAGLRLEHRFGTYQLGPPEPSYAVAVLRRA